MIWCESKTLPGFSCCCVINRLFIQPSLFYPSHYVSDQLLTLRSCANFISERRRHVQTVLIVFESAPLSINQSADVRGESMAAWWGGDTWRGRGKVWQSLTVGTEDPGCFEADGERGRESEAEVERVSFYRKGEKKPHTLCISPLGNGESEKCGKGGEGVEKKIGYEKNMKERNRH